jgi:tetratricopeptide (TPR) repeat protein
LHKYLIGTQIRVWVLSAIVKFLKFPFMTNRLEQLLRFYEEDPNDPFNIYGLALEYLKTDPPKSRKLFDTLLEMHPEYLPAYYHAARLYATTDRDAALEIYERGIQLAKKINDLKALRELQSAYQELAYE